MCACGKPTINGQPNAYSWDGRTFTTRQPVPPPLMEGDELIHDEPGRCGGIDAHSHHFRLVKQYSATVLLVQHGGGTERVDLGCTGRLIRPTLDALDSNARYWLLHMLYSTHRDGVSRGQDQTNRYWRKAAAEGRIKTRKMRGVDAVKVTVLSEYVAPQQIAS